LFVEKKAQYKGDYTREKGDENEYGYSFGKTIVMA